MSDFYHEDKYKRKYGLLEEWFDTEGSLLTQKTWLAECRDLYKANPNPFGESHTWAKNILEDSDGDGRTCKTKEGTDKVEACYIALFPRKTKPYR